MDGRGRTADGPQAETRDRYNDKFYGDAKSPEKEVSRGFHPVHARARSKAYLKILYMEDGRESRIYLS